VSLHHLIRPAALQEGDCIGLAAPASFFDPQALRVGIEVMQGWGFRVHYTSRVFDRYRYLAGSDAARAAELHALFVNPDIKAILCCRGGYGAQRLLPYLDPDLIAAHPKIFMGYSDLTSLLLYLHTQCGLVTLHGPVVAKDIHPALSIAAQRQMKGILMGDEAAMQPPECFMQGLAMLSPGEAEGDLLGGCLSLLVCATGTPFQPDMQGRILFLEDRGERLYAIDRMLTALRLAGLFNGVRGILFGHFEPAAVDRDQPYGIQEIILDVLGDLQVPILYGFPAGHCHSPVTLPFGTRVAIRKGRLVLCETPVMKPVGSLASSRQ
jgi:muramoyltetrapeptide carboxypeptidase